MHAAPDPLRRWDAMDRLFDRWDHLRTSRRVEDWDLATLTGNLLADWPSRVVLEQEKAAGICAHDGVSFLAIPAFWPFVQAAGGESECGLRSEVFDDALNAAIVGDTAAAVIDALMEREGEGAGTEPSLAVWLAIEATLSFVPAPEQAGLRTLVALRGVPQPSGWRRLA